jgi:argininosuccinate synthase
VTVDTGGIDAAAAKTLGERAKALGAIEHHQVDARADYFEQVLRFLIIGNVRRGQLYPLCVGAERVMQAQTIALMARKLGTGSIAHGCTAAGNDQVRFEVALRTLAPDLECSRRCATRPSSARKSSSSCRSASCPCRRTAPRTRSTAACGA